MYLEVDSMSVFATFINMGSYIEIRDDRQGSKGIRQWPIN